MFAYADMRTGKLVAADPDFETAHKDRLLRGRPPQCCIPRLTVIDYDCGQPAALPIGECYAGWCRDMPEYSEPQRSPCVPRQTGQTLVGPGPARAHDRD